MAYTDDTVLAKLSALNETQEGIVTVAQWIMFHRYGSIILFNTSTRDRGHPVKLVSNILEFVSQETRRAHITAMDAETERLNC